MDEVATDGRTDSKTHKTDFKISLRRKRSGIDIFINDILAFYMTRLQIKIIEHCITVSPDYIWMSVVYITASPHYSQMFAYLTDVCHAHHSISILFSDVHMFLPMFIHDEHTFQRK